MFIWVDLRVPWRWILWDLGFPNLLYGVQVLGTTGAPTPWGSGLRRGTGSAMSSDFKGPAHVWETLTIFPEKSWKLYRYMCIYYIYNIYNIYIYILHIYIYIYIYSISLYCNITARRCVLPGKFTWRLSTILQHAQTPVQGQCFRFPRRRALNPKS